MWSSLDIVDFFSGPSWLAKFDPDGRRLWRHRLGGAAKGVATDAAGNIVVGTNEGFVASLTKLDPDGRRLWRRQVGDFSHGVSVATDGAGNVVVASGPLLAKYSGEGDLLWTTQLANDPDSGSAIATDADGNIVLT